MDLRHITSPLSDEVIRGLAVGDMVSLSGMVVTGRDQVHKYLASGGTPPMDLKGLVIYHCGPVVIEENGRWKITAAGPTTSIREEPYEADIIARFRPGAIMGKGGMGDNTSAALKEYGCVYLHATGGAAQYLAERIIQVKTVLLPEFGQPESMWVLAVESLPALVTMDSQGRSLHSRIQKESLDVLNTLFEHRLTDGNDI